MQTQYHYHIHWTGKTKTLVDWERFATAEEAKSCAAQLVLKGESYTIEKFDNDCTRCRQFREESSRAIRSATTWEAKAQALAENVSESEDGA